MASFDLPEDPALLYVVSVHRVIHILWCILGIDQRIRLAEIKHLLTFVVDVTAIVIIIRLFFCPYLYPRDKDMFTN